MNYLKLTFMIYSYLQFSEIYKHVKKLPKFSLKEKFLVYS